jgi:hypothetical protein
VLVDMFNDIFLSPYSSCLPIGLLAVRIAHETG